MTRRIVDRCEFDRHARLLKSSELKSLMRAARLEQLETYFMLFSPRHKVFTPLHAVEPWFRRVPIGAQYFMVGAKPKD